MNDRMKFLFFVLLMFVGMTSIHSQTYIDENVSQAQTLIEQQTDLVVNSSAVQVQNGVLLGNTGSNVFLTQIGNNNQADLEVRGAETNVISTTFVQLGDDNKIDLELAGETFDMIVLQEGDDLTVNGFNSLNLSNGVNTQINQQGNGQTLIIEGQNSISNSMQINMSGQGQEVIVRSFN